MRVAAAAPIEFDVVLDPFSLEAGATLASHRAHAWVWSTEADQTAIAVDGEPEPDVPTVLVLPPLTHGANVAGSGGFWDSLVGPGRVLLPWAHRIVAFSPLGSCFGTTGAADDDFPKRVQDTRFSPCPPLARGMPRGDERILPATVTPWDQAKSVLLALDALGLDRIDLAVGGSLGGMVAPSLAMIAPQRFDRVCAIATPLAASAWMIGWNHAMRAALLADPTFPLAREGMRVARQIARMTYRSPFALAERQGRRIAGPAHLAESAAWSSRTPYRVETYLEHAADTFAMDARAYLCLTSSMDHHDLLRAPNGADAHDWGLARIAAEVFAIGISSDVLVPPEEVRALHDALVRAGVRASYAEIASARGHDAFLSGESEVHRAIANVVSRLARARARDNAGAPEARARPDE